MERERITFDPAKLEQARQRKLYSVKGLADAAGVHRHTVSNALKGLPVFVDTARLICERLGVTRDEVCKP